MRRARHKKGMTQVELAAASDCTQSTIADIERGRSGVSLALATRLAAALGTTTTELFDQSEATL